MKFPRFQRLPGRRMFPLLTWDRIRFYLIGLGLMCLTFLVGFYLFFPTQALKEKIEREFSARTGVPLSIGRLYLGFPPALEARSLSIAVARPGRERFDVASLRLRPLWLTLFGNSPGADFDASLLGGEISGRARRNGPIEAKAQQLAFAEALTPGSALELAGVLGQATFTGALPPAATTESRFELLFDSLQLNGMESLGIADGNLTLGRVTCTGNGRGNNYRIDRLEATGGEMAVSGNGSFILSQPVEQSRINLNLTLRPGANFDRTLRDLLDLFATPGRDGSYSLRINGTLATPVFAK